MWAAIQAFLISIPKIEKLILWLSAQWDAYLAAREVKRADAALKKANEELDQRELEKFFKRDE